MERETETEKLKEKVFEFWTGVVKGNIHLFSEVTDKLKDAFRAAIKVNGENTLIVAAVLMSFLTIYTKVKDVEEAKLIAVSLIDWCAKETKFRIENGYWRFTE